jgi:hypothetical protein
MRTYRLTIDVGSGAPVAAELIDGEYVVGRGEGVQIQVRGDGMAERHGVLRLEAGQLWVDTLAVGLKVNGCEIGERVEVALPVSLEFPGVRLELGEQEGAGGMGVPREDVPLLEDPDKTWVMPVGARRGGAVARPATLSDLGSEEAGRNFAFPQGRYELVREIARGGMGKIFFGLDAELKREVAIKVSSVSEGGEDPRFRREAEVLAQLAHPNIVPVHTMGQDSEGRPYYAMKLVKGRTLQAILSGLAKGEEHWAVEYPLSRLLLIFQKVCDAMAFAHSQGFLHRDLKPENIMVGEYGEVLVMDWGLAKNLRSGDPEEVGSGKGRVGGAEWMGVTQEGEVMGTPQYMSPEQAEGRVGELDERSDVYALGGVLCAILTLRPPVEGKTLEEVLTRVKSGRVSALERSLGPVRGGAGKGAEAMERRVPEALRAVALKAMALDRNRRYRAVADLAQDLEAYQSGFATEAENAGAFRRLKLWVGRNKVLAGGALAMALVVSGFSAKLVVEGRKASEALERLRSSAPVFAQRAEEALRQGELETALEAASNAVSLEPEEAEYHRIRGNVLQVMLRFPEAVEAYKRAEGDDLAEKNLRLTQELMALVGREGEAKVKARLFQELNVQGRHDEARSVSRDKDPGVIPELVKRLEAKLLPVPGTPVWMCSTEFTVGEWKLYLKAEGLPEWTPPSRDARWKPSSETPVIWVSWNQVMGFCEWLRKVTGQEWGLPANVEWEAAVGNVKYPWGDYFPPHWDDGNYAIFENGRRDDKKRTGADGIYGAAPVASFKVNPFGFYDLGGNVWEMTSDKIEQKSGKVCARGESWCLSHRSHSVSVRVVIGPDERLSNVGFRLVRR